MGDVANSSRNQASKSSEQVNKALDTISKNLDISKKQLQSIGVDGTSSFAKLTNAQKGAILNAKHFETATIQDINKVKELANGTLKWKDQMELARLQIQATGGNVDTLKGKFQTVGIALESSFISKIEPVRNKFESIKTTITGVAGTVTQKLSTAFNPITSKVTNLASNIKTKLGSAVKSVGTAVNNLGQKFSGLGGVISSALGALGMASISQLTIGLAMTREQMTNLTTATMGSEKAANNFVNTMDKMTNNSLVSLNDLGQAMSTIKISTGVTNAELEKLLPTVNDVGQRAILMGKNSDEAMNMMTAAGKGLNGEFDILKSNFGVTKEALKDLGWKGTTEDVEGYIEALNKYMEKAGSMDSMMDTTTGKIAQVKKGFTSAGRQIGEVFMPYINQALDYMLGLKESCPDIYKGFILVGAGISGLATVLPSISPTIDAFNSLSNGVSNAKKMISGIGDTVSTAKSAIDGFKTAQEGADVATKLLAASTLGLSTEEAVLSATNAGLTMEQYESLLASNLQAAGYTEVATAAEGAAVAEGMALLPLLAIAAAIGAVIVVAYELGKSFGWWKDAGSMIDAVTAGVQRLWSAFVNNEDVQNIIQGITEGFQWLYQALTPVGQWFMDVLGIVQPAGEEFDIVRAIIDVLGGAFHLLVQHLTNLYDSFMFIVGCIQNTISFFQWLYIIITQAPVILSEFITGVITWLSQLPVMVWTWISSTATQIVHGLLTWVKHAKSKAKSFVTAIIGFIKTLPQRVFSYISSTAHRIASGINNWVSNARNGASKVVSGVINYISSIPGKVYNEFAKIPGKIFDAMNSAVDAAGKWGQSVLDAAMNALGIHSPGFIQKRTIAEFENTNKRILNTVGAAKTAGAKFGESIMKGYNSSFGLDLSNQNLQSETTITFDHSLGVTLDLANIPSGMSESDLASMINSDKFVTAIAENSKFQQADTNMKNRNNRRIKRANGVL